MVRFYWQVWKVGSYKSQNHSGHIIGTQWSFVDRYNVDITLHMATALSRKHSMLLLYGKQFVLMNALD